MIAELRANQQAVISLQERLFNKLEESQDHSETESDD